MDATSVACQPEITLQQAALPSNAPVDASSRHPSTDPPRRKPVLLKDSEVPRFEACGAEEDFAACFQGAVESSHLGEGVRVLGVEPVHAVHDLDCFCQECFEGAGGGLVGFTYYSMAQGARGDSANHFLELVGVDA